MWEHDDLNVNILEFDCTISDYVNKLPSKCNKTYLERIEENGQWRDLIYNLIDGALDKDWQCTKGIYYDSEGVAHHGLIWNRLGTLVANPLILDRWLSAKKSNASERSSPHVMILLITLLATRLSSIMWVSTWDVYKNRSRTHSRDSSQRPLYN